MPMPSDNGFHVLERLPTWLLFVKAAQILLSVIILGLDAYADHIFGAFDWVGFGIFTVVATWLICAYWIASVKFMTKIFNYWAILATEIFMCIFWLSSMALFAEWAAAWSLVDWVGYNYDYWKKPHDCVAAAAGLSAIELILFLVTLVFTVIALMHHFKSASPAAAHGADVENKGGVIQTTTELNQVPVQQQNYEQQGYQQQTSVQQPYQQQQ